MKFKYLLFIFKPKNLTDITMGDLRVVPTNHGLIVTLEIHTTNFSFRSPSNILSKWESILDFGCFRDELVRAWEWFFLLWL